jgi:hypothetical protein
MQQARISAWVEAVHIQERTINAAISGLLVLCTYFTLWSISGHPTRAWWFVAIGSLTVALAIAKLLCFFQPSPGGGLGASVDTENRPVVDT